MNSVSKYDLKYYFDELKRRTIRAEAKTYDSEIDSLMFNVHQHNEWQSDVAEKLNSLGVNIESTEAPGLGKLWKQESVAKALARSQKLTNNTEVVKEIFLGLTEQMKKITAFITALSRLGDLDADLNSEIKGGRDCVDLTTSDGYTFAERVRPKFGDNYPGINIYFGGSQHDAVTMIDPYGNAWAKYLQSAEVEHIRGGGRYETGLPNPSGWHDDSQIATIALTGAAGANVLIEHGTSIDNSKLIKASANNLKDATVIGDADVVGHLGHVLYKDEDPLFTNPGSLEFFTKKLGQYLDDSTIKTALETVKRHENNLEGVVKQLENFGAPVKAVQIPGLGTMWEVAEVETSLRNNQDSRVLTEIFLGVAEQIKKTIAFTTAMTRLIELEPKFEKYLDSRTRGSFDMKTRDGYKITQAYFAKPSASWSRELKIAQQNYASGARSPRNPGGWETGSKIATLQLMDGKGRSVLFESGKRPDGTLAIKACLPNKDDRWLSDTSEVDRVNTSLYGAVNPIFKKSK